MERREGVERIGKGNNSQNSNEEEHDHLLEFESFVSSWNKYSAEHYYYAELKKA